MIEWAITSSVLILVVLVLRRLLMGKMSLRLQYALWALVLLRLLLPISFGATSVSVLNAMERTQALQMSDPVPGYVRSDTPPVSDPLIPSEAQEEQNVSQREVEIGGPIDRGTVILGVWVVGAAGMGLWLLWVNARFARKLRRSRVPLAAAGCPRSVYVTGAIQTPCLFGMLRPCIYVTEEVADDETVLRHTLAHELTHYRHGDYIWSALRGLCLALHWYNPLVWVAAALSKRDGELCCDAATVKKLGEGERAAYGRTLLAVTCQGRTNPMLTATSMTGSGKGIKERISLLTKYPKTAVYTLMVVVIVAATAVGYTFTGAEKGDGEGQITLGQGIDVPQAVADYARDYVQEAWNNYEEQEGYHITSAEIVGITQIDTGTAAENSGVNLYRLEYRLWPSDSDQVVLADGMKMEEGAITEWSSAGQPYLLLCWQDGDKGRDWEPVCVTDTNKIAQAYGTPEMLEKYGNQDTAAAMELYLQFRGESNDG